MRSGSDAVTCFLKFWQQSIKYTVRVVTRTNGLKQFLVSFIQCLESELERYLSSVSYTDLLFTELPRKRWIPQSKF